MSETDDEDLTLKEWANRALAAEAYIAAMCKALTVVETLLTTAPLTRKDLKQAAQMIREVAEKMTDKNVFLDLAIAAEEFLEYKSPEKLEALREAAKRIWSHRATSGVVNAAGERVPSEVMERIYNPKGKRSGHA